MSIWQMINGENNQLLPAQESDISKAVVINEIMAFQFRAPQGDGDAIHTYIAKRTLLLTLSSLITGKRSEKLGTSCFIQPKCSQRFGF